MFGGSRQDDQPVPWHAIPTTVTSAPVFGDPPRIDPRPRASFADLPDLRTVTDIKSYKHEDLWAGCNGSTAHCQNCRERKSARSTSGCKLLPIEGRSSFASWIFICGDCVTARPSMAQ